MWGNGAKPAFRGPLQCSARVLRSQPREKPAGEGARLLPVEGAVSLQTATRPSSSLDPRPKGRHFRRLSGRPHLGLQKFACCLTAIYFLSSDFTGCQRLAFLFLSLSPTLSSAQALP